MILKDSTKQIVRKVQQIKPHFTDPVSPIFIDFYCQCKQGIDYLFTPIKELVQLVDILQWFVDCVDKKAPTPLIELIWQDIAGLPNNHINDDNAIEKKLRAAFASNELRSQIKDWDLKRMNSGGMQLILINLLAEISRIEKEHQVQ
jgi:hypothetical protein